MFRFIQISLFPLLMLLCTACSKADTSDWGAEEIPDDIPIITPAKKLEIQSVSSVAMPFTITEPSDLCYSFSGNSLYTVDDNTGKVFEIDFNANILKTFPKKFGDLEGVAIDCDSKHIFISEETTRFIIRLDQNGTPVDTIRALNSGILPSPPIDLNHGLEGLTVHGDTIYLVNQEDPGMYLKYNCRSKAWMGKDFNIGKQSNGKAGSYAGLCYDISDNTIWLLCSKSNKIIHCNQNFEILDTLNLPDEIIKPEGITVSTDHSKIWLVTDNKPSSRLYTILLK